MSEKKQYQISIPGETHVAQWDEQKFQANKDQLFKDHKDAQVIEVNSFDPGYTPADNDYFQISIPGEQHVASWDAKRFQANRDQLLKDHPDAQIQRVTPVNYWRDKRNEISRDLSLLDKRDEETMAKYGLTNPDVDVPAEKSETGMPMFADQPQVQRDNTNTGVPTAEILAAMQSKKNFQDVRKDLEQQLYDNPDFQEERKYMLAESEKRAQEYEQKQAETTGDESRNYKLAKRLNNEAIDTWQAPSQYDDSNPFVNFMQGSKKTLGSADFWTMGISTIANNMQLLPALKGIQDKLGTLTNATEEEIDSKLDDSEKALLLSFARKINADSQRAFDMSLGYQSGQSATDSLGFMAQFILTGGVGKVAARRATKGMTKWLAKGIGSMSSGMAKEATRAVAKFGLGSIQAATKAAVMTPLMPSTYKNMTDMLLQVDDEGKLDLSGKAIRKAYGDSLIETMSESAGTQVEGILGLPFKAAGKVGADIFKNTAFGDWAKVIKNAPAMKLLKQAGWNGYIGEYGEEWYGAALRTMTGVDKNALKDMTDIENQIVTLTSFAPMSLIGGSISAGQYGLAKHNLGKAEAGVRRMLEDHGYDEQTIGNIMEQIKVEGPYSLELSKKGKFDTPEDIAQKLAPVLYQVATDNGIDKQVYRSVMDYARAVAKYQLFDGIQQSDQQERRDNLAEEIKQQIGGDFWTVNPSETENQDGSPYRVEMVRDIEWQDGSHSYVRGSDESGRLIAVGEGGKVNYLTEDQIEAQKKTGEIVEFTTDRIDRFLDKRLAAKKAADESARVAQQKSEQVQQLQERIDEEHMVNLGTAENPMLVPALGKNDQGVIVQMPDGTTPLVSWEKVGAGFGTPLQAQTDQEIEDQEVNDLVQKQDIKDRLNEEGRDIKFSQDDQTYTLDRVIEIKDSEEGGEMEARVMATDQNGNETEVIAPVSAIQEAIPAELASPETKGVAAEPEQAPAAEQEEAPVDNRPKDFRGNPIPVKADGVSVDQNSFWNNDPEAWARWNDEKRNDGGANSMGYIEKAIRAQQGRIDAVQEQLDNETDHDAIETLESDRDALRQRADLLQELWNGYDQRAKEAVAEQKRIEEEQKALQKREQERAEAIQKEKEREIRKPVTMQELASSMMAQKGFMLRQLDREDFMRETGMGQKEARRFNAWFAKKGTKGKSIASLAEDLAQYDSDMGTGLVPRDANADQADVLAARDAILDLIMSQGSAQGVRDFAAKEGTARVLETQYAEEEAEEAARAQFEAENGMSYEDYEANWDPIIQQSEADMATAEEYENNINFVSEYSNYDSQGIPAAAEGEAAGSISQGSAGSSEEGLHRAGGIQGNGTQEGYVQAPDRSAAGTGNVSEGESGRSSEVRGRRTGDVDPFAGIGDMPDFRITTQTLDGAWANARSLEEKAQIARAYLEEIKSEKELNSVFVTADTVVGLLRALRANEETIKAVEDRLANCKRKGQRPAGFTLGGLDFMFIENYDTLDDVRSTYVHERQHRQNKADSALVDSVMKAAGRRELRDIVRKLSGTAAYDGEKRKVLADEFTAFALEEAYKGGDFAGTLRQAGASEDLINIIAEENERQSNSQGLSVARRGWSGNEVGGRHDSGSRRYDGSAAQRGSGEVAGPRSGSVRRGDEEASGRGREVTPLDRVLSVVDNTAVRTAEERLADNGIASNGDEVRWSIRYVLNPEQKADVIRDGMRVTGRSKEDVTRWVDSEQGILPMFLDEHNRDVLDYAADDRYKAIKSDADYPQGTVDFNNICRKRVPFTKIYQRLQKAHPGKVITGRDLAKIRNIMKAHGITVACGLCYVEDRRQLLGEIAQKFIDGVNDNFQAYENQLDAKGNLSETKKKNAEKFRSLLGNDTKADLSIYDLITTEGSDALYREHRGIYDAFQAYNNARGQQAGNLFQGYAEYKREILDWSDEKVKVVNDNGGLRIFSYSDFEAHHLLDLIQIISDCAVRGVKIQSYTKVPAFARIVARTGMKLNRSLIPLGDTGIVDGKLAYDPVEGIDINDPDFLPDNENIGNVLIGINDEQIRMAMVDPFVHYIIPYHSNQSGELRTLKQTGKWTNYKNYQVDKGEGTGKHGVNIYTDVLNAAEAEGKPIKTEREFTERFLAVCKERNWTPRFWQFLDKDVNGGYVYTPGYYKLLLDFKLFDEQGNLLPQEPVKAEFDNEVLKRVLDEYIDEERLAAGETYDDIYAEIEKAILGGGKTVKPRKKTAKTALKEQKTGKQIVSDADLTGEPQWKISGNNRKTIDRWLDKWVDAHASETRNPEATRTELAKVKEDVIGIADSMSNPTAQLAYVKWFCNGSIQAGSEDVAKVEQAVETARRHKVDPLSFSAPMDIVNQWSESIKEKPVDPETVSTLHRAKEVPGTKVVIYNVDDSQESRKNMRQIINTHFGKDCSPWCLLQGDGEGNLTSQSADYWQHYNAYPKQVAFNDGKLIAFSANSSSTRLWWDRQDRSHIGVPVIGKIKGDELGRSGTEVRNPETGEIMEYVDLHKGNKQDGEYMTWLRINDPFPESVAHYKDGKNDGSLTLYTKDGTVRLESNWKGGVLDGLKRAYYLDGQLKFEENYKDGLMDGITREYNQDGILTREAEYKAGDQQYEKTFNNRGNLVHEETFLKGHGNSDNIDYYDDGKIKSRYAVRDYHEESRTDYDKDGNVTLSREMLQSSYYHGSDVVRWTENSQETKGLVTEQVNKGQRRIFEKDSFNGVTFRKVFTDEGAGLYTNDITYTEQYDRETGEPVGAEITKVDYIDEAKKKTSWVTVKYDGDEVKRGEHGFNIDDMIDGFLRKVKEEGSQPSWKITAEQDAEYQAAYESGDEAKAMAMLKQAFKAAFPESKMVDKSGDPVVVYHGTSLQRAGIDLNTGELFEEEQPFTVFHTDSEMGAHFGTRGQAETRAWNLTREGSKDMYIYPVFLNLSNPAGVSDVNSFHADKLVPGLVEDGYLTEEEGKIQYSDASLKTLLKEKGYDGLVYFNNWEGYGLSYVAFDSNQVKSAEPFTFDDSGNLIPLSKRFNPESNDIRWKMANDSQRIFVSNAAAALDKIPMKKGNAQAWINKLQQAGGLKKEEDKWLGISDWLKSRKGDIAKEDIAAFIESNMVQIEDVKYSASASMEDANKEYIKENYGDGKELWELQAEIDEHAESASRYDEVGENDGPMLDIWLTDVMKQEYGDDFVLGYNIEDGAIDYVEIDPYDTDEDAFWSSYEGTKGINSTRLDYTTKGLEKKREIALTVPTIEPYNTSDNIHFGDAGEGRAVAWSRFGETADADGNRVLVIDEIQSKRHQDGKEKGYEMPFDDMLQAKGYTLEDDGKFWVIRDKEGYSKASVNKVIAPTEEDAKKNLKRSLIGLSSDNNVPDAPFRDNWHELAMKRMLRLAAEEGYDKIAWTNGNMQADRYSLAHVFDGVRRVGNTFHFFGKGQESIEVDDNGIVTKSTMWNLEGEKFSTVVGKGLADRLMSLGDNETLDQEGMRVGGEGMRFFYDQKLPGFMDKYGKKWGVSVQDIDLPGLETVNGWHSIDVTDAMKESVMGGQPMFKITGEDSVEKIPHLRRRKEGESASDFTWQIVGEIMSRYKLPCNVSILPYESKDGLSASYNPKTKTIRIFTKQNIKHGIVLENDIFHESIHAAYDKLGKIASATIGQSIIDHPMFDNSRSDIEEMYPEDRWLGEYAAHAISWMMTTGDFSALGQATDEERNELDQILNQFGYDRGNENAQRARFRENAKRREDAKRAAEDAARSEEARPEEGLTYSDVNWKIVSDKKTIDWLEKQPTKTVYHAMQIITMADGKRYLFPPMAAVQGGEYVQGIPVNEDGTIDPTWEMADEHPELAFMYTAGKKGVKIPADAEIEKRDGKWFYQGKEISGEIDPESGEFVPNWYFSLNKGNKGDAGKKLTDLGKVAYDPYQHSGENAVNDQFTTAYDRSHLVIVEVQVPVSELTGESGYKADKAKLGVGTHPWTGGKLKASKRRMVTLSRWDKPTKILSDQEVAEDWKKVLDDNGLKEVPFNIVTPGQRQALMDLGVKIGQPTKDNAGVAARGAYNDWKAQQGDEARFKITAAQDKEYMAAVEAGDMEKAQQMVDAAAEQALADSQVRDEDGNLLHMHHGSRADKNFYIFDTYNSLGEQKDLSNVGSHFGPKSTAKEFSKDNLFDVYLNLKKIWDAPFDFFADTWNNAYLEALIDLDDKCQTPEAHRIFERIYYVYPILATYDLNNISILDEFGDDEGLEEEAKFGKNGAFVIRKAWLDHRNAMVEIMRDMMKAEGYDGIAYDNWYEGEANNTCYVALYPDQIKLADPVTRDDQGNVIPLSERFSDSEDIRWKIGDVEEAYTKEMNDAQKEYSQARESILGHSGRMTPQEFQAHRDELKKIADDYNAKRDAIIEKYRDDLIKEEEAARQAEKNRYDSVGEPDPERGKRLFAAAKEHFGTTDDFREAGYIVPDGDMIDLSGKNDGGQKGHRQADHRDINAIIEDRTYSSNTEYMDDFINEGAIRIAPEMGLVTLANKPTAEQKGRLRDYLYKHVEDGVDVEIYKASQSVASPSYRPKTAVSRILDDIAAYFDEGKIPQGNVSWKITPEMDQQFAEAEKAGDEKTARKLLMQAARIAMPDTKVVDENGDPMVVYHGSDKAFTKFQPNGYVSMGFFTNDKDLAQAFGDRMALEGDAEKSTLYQSFLNLQNPLEVDLEGEVWDNFNIDRGIAEKLEIPYEAETDALDDNDEPYKPSNAGDFVTNSDMLAKAITDHPDQYDGLILRHVSGENVWEWQVPVDDFIATRPSQVKSAETFTYDDTGKLIPLSQRFNDQEEDIRWKIAKGEKYESMAERQYRETGEFSFTGRHKIESAYDVAFLFRELQEKATENSFVVFVKDGIPTILHTGIGSIAATQIDITAAVAGYNDFEPDTVYMVHNHPSGNIFASSADVKTLMDIKKAMPGVAVEGVILDTMTGKFGTFDVNNDTAVGRMPLEENEEAVPVKVQSFDKMVFDPSFRAEYENRQVRSSKDIAAFLSAHRLGQGNKMSALMMNHSMVITADYVTNFNTLTEDNAEKIAMRLADVAVRSGSTLIALTGNFNFEPEAVRALKNALGNASGSTMQLIDVVQVDKDGRAFSIADDTLHGMDDGARWKISAADEADSLSGKQNAARKIADTLGVKFEAVSSKDMPEGHKGAQGYWKDGKIYVCLENNADADEAVRTVLHEAVGHEGLRKLIGQKDFSAFMMDVYKRLPASEREKVTDAALAKGGNFTEATEEYLASLAENLNSADNDSVWNVVRQAIARILGKIGINVPLSQKDLRWMLWQSANVLGQDDIMTEISRQKLANRLGFSLSAQRKRSEVRSAMRLREISSGSDSASRMYNRYVMRRSARLHETYVDMNDAINALVESIEKSSGKKAEAYEDVRKALNQQSSKGLAAMEKWERKYWTPLMDAVREIMKDAGIPQSEVERYVMLKHAVERNMVFAQRDARNFYKEIRDQKIARAKGDDSLSKADKDLAIDQAVEDYNDALAAIGAGTDPKFKEFRQLDYGGLTGMYSTFDEIDEFNPNMESREEYERRAKNARHPMYDNVADMEERARQDVEDYERMIGLMGVKNLWDAINGANKATLKHQYDSNMLTRQQYESVRDMFEYYVPLRGFAQTTAEDMYTYYMSGQNNSFEKPLKAAEGRRTEAESPFGYIGAMASSAIAQNVKNETKMALYFFLSNRAGNDLVTVSEQWFELVDQPDGSAAWEPAVPEFTENISGEEARAQYAAWEQRMESLREEGKAQKGRGKLGLDYVINISDRQKKSHVIQFKLAGRDMMMFINGNPRAAQALNNELNVEMSTDYQKVFGRFLRWFSGINTSYNPEFWLSNAQRDILFAMMSMDVKEDGQYNADFRRNFGKAMKALAAGGNLKKKYEEDKLGSSQIEKWYKEFVEGGGVTGYTTLKKNEEWDAEIRRHTGEKKVILQGVRDAFDKVADYGERIEQMTRFAAFMTARENGKNVIDAVADAKELTVNFNRKGSGKAISWEEAKMLTDDKGNRLDVFQQAMTVGMSWLPVYGRRFIMFFNAATQGLNAMYQLYKKNTKRMTVWTAAYVMLGVINAAVHAMLDDDDDYLDIPDYERRTNLLVGGSGAYFKWAMPQECRVFYGIGDMMVNHALGRTPHKTLFSEVASSVLDVAPLNPAGGLSAWAPSATTPFVEVLMNRDFKGAKIYNDMKYLSDEERKRTPNFQKAYAATGKMYVNMSQGLNWLSGGDKTDAGWININPAAVEHIVEGVTGGAGTTVEKLFQTLMVPMGAEEFSVRNTPFLRRILVLNDERSRNAHTTDLFNYYKAEAEHTAVRIKKYKKEGDSKSLEKLMKSDDVKIMNIYESYKKIMKDFNDQIKITDDSRQRRDLMHQQDEIRKQMIKQISEIK